jgi:hypothetical protein
MGDRLVWRRPKIIGVYLRNSYRDGRIGVYQIKASNRLALKKTVLVPKLELNAALLWSRLTQFVCSCPSKKIQSHFFWTGSSTVRHWIRATASYYQVYVLNCVGEIQTLTEPEKWRFVQGKLNPADEATRSVIEEECSMVERTRISAPTQGKLVERSSLDRRVWRNADEQSLRFPSGAKWVQLLQSSARSFHLVVISETRRHIPRKMPKGEPRWRHPVLEER